MKFVDLLNDNQLFRNEWLCSVDLVFSVILTGKI
jgi:hypothetical protein